MYCPITVRRAQDVHIRKCELVPSNTSLQLEGVAQAAGLRGGVRRQQILRIGTKGGQGNTTGILQVRTQLS